jgi:hypothetical protein
MLIKLKMRRMRRENPIMRLKNHMDEKTARIMALTN